MGGAECNTDHCLVIAKFKDRLSVIKPAGQKFDMQRFDLKKLSEVEMREQQQFKISNRFAGLDNLRDSGDINTTWENIEENVKEVLNRAYAMNKCSTNHGLINKCSKCVDKMKQAELQWLQDPSQIQII